MSRCREDVYLAGTDLMAWGGHCISIPCSITQRVPMCLSVCISYRDVCCLWLTREYGRCQCTVTCIRSDTAEPVVWQACDGAELVLNDFLGSITLPKHWTCHLPFPISPSWSQNRFPIHKWSADCTLPFTQYRLITHRYKLACTQIGHLPATANQRKELRWW